MEERYKVARVVCFNCGFKEIDVVIPKGKTLREWLKENPTCCNCGCNKRPNRVA